MFGCGLGAGAASCWALKQAAHGGALASPTAQRLQLGLMGFSIAAISLDFMYANSITVGPWLTKVGVLGITFALPYWTYRGSLHPGDLVARYFGAIPDHLRITGLQSALYSVLTPTLALAGAAYLFTPGESLAAAFGYLKDPASLFLWQNAGAALLIVAPAVTYSLKKEADGGSLGGSVARTLNAGLLLASLGHVAVLSPMVAAGQGGPALPWLLGAWAAGAVTGALGLFSGSTAAAGAKA